MLYDPKWEAQADPISLESLIAWLEKQKPGDRYSYVNIFRCPLTQWLRSHFTTVEFHPAICLGNCTYKVDGKIICLDNLEPIILGSNVGRGWSWTYGAALHRARKQLAAQYA